MKRTYEDEKRENLAIYLSDKPELKELFRFEEDDIKLMNIKVGLHIIGRTVIKNFRLKCDKIIRNLNHD
jgi:hypothetical protein